MGFKIGHDSFDVCRAVYMTKVDVDEELTRLGAAEVCAEAAEERRNTPPPVGVEDNIGPEGGSGQDDGAPMMTYQTQCWEEVERLVDAHLEDAGKELWGKAKDEGAFIEELRDGSQVRSPSYVLAADSIPVITQNAITDETSSEASQESVPMHFPWLTVSVEHLHRAKEQIDLRTRTSRASDQTTPVFLS